MSNSVDPDEMAHYEPSHLDLCCLQKSIIMACGSERVKVRLILYNTRKRLKFIIFCFLIFHYFESADVYLVSGSNRM